MLDQMGEGCQNAQKQSIIKKISRQFCTNLYLSINMQYVFIIHLSERAQWHSGRVLDSRPRGHGFEPHRRYCVVVLEQDTQEDPSLFNWKIVDGA